MTTSICEVPRIALVGCGAIAEMLYLPVLAQNPSTAQRVTLVDLNHARVQALADRFGFDAYAQDYRDVIPQVDGVIVALPHSLHFEVSLDFLRSGVHVLCEKPLVETSEQAQMLIQEAEQQGVSLMVNNTRRLFPSFRKVKELITNGDIGQPLGFQIEEGSQYNWPTVSGFYFDKQSGGGVLADTGAHVVDLVCWWFDSRPQVIGYTDDSFGGCEAMALLELQVVQSVRGTIKLSRLTRLSNQYVITGEHGAIVCTPFDWRRIRLMRGGRMAEMRLPSREKSIVDFGAQIVANFIQVILGNERPLISGEDAIDSISVLQECYGKRRRFEMPWMEVR